MNKTSFIAAVLMAALSGALCRNARAGGLGKAEWIKEQRLKLEVRELASATTAPVALEYALMKDEQEVIAGPVLSYYYDYSLYWFDLRGDGRPCAIVDIENSAHCGTGGCELEIYRADEQGRYKRAFTISGAHHPIIVSNRKTQGWNDLLITGYGEYKESKTWGFHVLRFDGKSYPDVEGTDRVPDGTVIAGFLLAESSRTLEIPRGYEPEKSQLTGKLILKHFPGPPGYGENPSSDAREVAYILELLQPIDVRRIEGESLDVDDVSEDNVREVQMVADPRKLKLDSFLGRGVAVRGTLFHSHTGHHHARILMRVEMVEPESISFGH